MTTHICVLVSLLAFQVFFSLYKLFDVVFLVLDGVPLTFSVNGLRDKDTRMASDITVHCCNISTVFCDEM